MGWCKNIPSDIFGRPGEGVHRYRLFGMAIVDIGVTLVGSTVVYYALRKRISWWKLTIGLFLLGIILHRALCVRTTVDRKLFGNDST